MKNMVNHESLIALAAAKLGYCHMYMMQMQAVKKLLEGNDVFVCLPTGAKRHDHVKFVIKWIPLEHEYLFRTTMTFFLLQPFLPHS